MKIEDLDSNFKKRQLEASTEYTNIRQTEASIEGVCPGTWQRLPDEVLEAVNRPALTELAHHTSGAVIRFKADARVLRLRMELLQPEFLMSHMALSGSAGMDIFADGEYVETCWAEYGGDIVETEFRLEKEAEITVYLPLYNGVKEFGIAMPKGGRITAPAEHKVKEKIVFYGSSITQGGCASRTSNNYTTLLARWLDAEIHCIGFSGNAQGDMPVAEYIAGIKPELLIYDYDYNAPTAKHLRDTHAPFLGRILKEHPHLPVLAISRPNPEHLTEACECEERRDIVRETVQKYREEGYDVHFLDGRDVFGEENRECCTVDGIHPNDLGFYRMAKTVQKYVKELLHLK